MNFYFYVIWSREFKRRVRPNFKKIWPKNTVENPTVNFDAEMKHVTTIFGQSALLVLWPLNTHWIQASLTIYTTLIYVISCTPSNYYFKRMVSFECGWPFKTILYQRRRDTYQMYVNSLRYFVSCKSIWCFWENPVTRNHSISQRVHLSHIKNSLNFISQGLIINNNRVLPLPGRWLSKWFSTFRSNQNKINANQKVLCLRLHNELMLNGCLLFWLSVEFLEVILRNGVASNGFKTRILENEKSNRAWMWMWMGITTSPRYVLDFSMFIQWFWRWIENECK